MGEFKNNGRELRPVGDPEKVRVHDFLIAELGRATPYGVYDLARNRGWVSVGMDHDTATFAVETIRRFWRSMGQAAYPEAERLLITAGAGGRNDARLRLWKLELQKLEDESGLRMALLLKHAIGRKLKEAGLDLSAEEALGALATVQWWTWNCRKEKANGW